MNMNALNNALGQIINRPASQRPSGPRLSPWSTPAVPDSAWSSRDFMLGAGMVLIQRRTHKIVVVHETRKDYWFFPRGRKDVGESLEQAALREAYEESGYRAQFLPLINRTHQPTSPQVHDYDSYYNTEPVFMSLTSWRPRRRRNGTMERYGGEYLTTWYAGMIEEDAVAETGTGMPDEQDYQSHVLPFDEAERLVFGVERQILFYVWEMYIETIKAIRDFERQEAERIAASQEAPPIDEHIAEPVATQS
ncbi:unnamed protein product [Cyclocybe aegerita]|uniref:Nudix hydrolase domain-containing protein n=1 Tax=Cyclocybe aegerita TaxID=1973307 RepID=A0A8S0XGU8_CYCAE|nr:unnamed protein product [Cyclocybe aegerita]